MGKNNGKRGKQTEFAKWESIMAKLDFQLKKEAEEANKKRKSRNK